MIIGCGGAGKSTLAKALHDITGLPLIHLDQLYWKPNWQETEKTAWETIVTEVATKPKWIIDGNYGGTMDIRLQEADTIIFLNRSTFRCLYRAMKRIIIHYGKTRPDMHPGCPEHFEWEFIHYILRYNLTRRPAILKKLEQLKGAKEVLIFRNDREVEAYLEALKVW